MPHLPRRDFLRQSAAGLAAATTLTGSRVARAAPPTSGGIKVAQIGTKHAHAAGKLATLRKFPDDWEVVAVAEPDEARAARVRDTPPYRGIPFVTVDELLNTPGLRAIAIETEVKDLLHHAELAVNAGMHIHLDKPAGEDLAHFKRILDEATRRKLTVQMGYMFRYNPAFQLMYRAVKQGWLGEVFELHAVISKTVNDTTRRELSQYPGGTMFELGCHVIDSAVYVLGRPEKVTPYTRRTRDDGFADNQLAVLENCKHFSGATATIRSAMVEYDGAQRRQFVVCGPSGTVDIKPLEPPHMRLALSQPRDDYKRGYQDVTFAPTGRYDGEFLDLARVIRGEKAFEWSPEHDYAVQETVLQASGLEAK